MDRADGKQAGRVVFRTKWFDVEELDSGDANGPYYRLTGQDAVVIFALTRAMEVVLVRQFRPARGHTTLELPAGGIEAGETADAAARRELREETGCDVDELHALGAGGLRLDRDSAVLHTYVAFGAHMPVGAARDGPEEVVTLPLAEFLDLVEKGSFEQLGALSAVLQAFLRFRDRLEPVFRSGNPEHAQRDKP